MKQPFNPPQLPIELTIEDKYQLLEAEMKARIKIQEFNDLIDHSIIKEELLLLFSMDESVQSTKLEGTQATFSDVFIAELNNEETADTQEVKNYLNALQMGEQLLQQLPICTKMLLQLHRVILHHSRGQNRNPGEYRTIQNFIGPDNNRKNAVYVPPEPQNVQSLISNLEKYINGETEDDRLGDITRAAIIHAQFETIHPFLDGNGRLGRILIILYLLEKKVINSTTFFISEELERNKHKYYTLLNNLRTSDPQWKEWILFFLAAAEKQAEKYIGKLKETERLYERLAAFAEENNIPLSVVRAIFSKPAFNAKVVQQACGVSDNTARSYCKKLIQSGLIYADDKVRNKTYWFYELIDVLER